MVVKLVLFPEGNILLLCNQVLVVGSGLKKKKKLKIKLLCYCHNATHIVSCECCLIKNNFSVISQQTKIVCICKTSFSQNDQHHWFSNQADSGFFQKWIH